MLIVWCDIDQRRIRRVRISLKVIIKWIQRELIMEIWIWKNYKGLIGKCNLLLFVIHFIQEYVNMKYYFENN